MFCKKFNWPKFTDLSMITYSPVHLWGLWITTVFHASSTVCKVLDKILPRLYTITYSQKKIFETSESAKALAFPDWATVSPSSWSVLLTNNHWCCLWYIGGLKTRNALKPTNNLLDHWKLLYTSNCTVVKTVSSCVKYTADICWVLQWNVFLEIIHGKNDNFQWYRPKRQKTCI